MRLWLVLGAVSVVLRVLTSVFLTSFSLLMQVRNKWVSTRLAALRWMQMLLKKMPEQIYKYAPPSCWSQGVGLTSLRACLQAPR